MTGKPDVLQVAGVTKLYRNRRGVRDIHFAIGEGEAFGLLGPNGSGKTTIMKVITGLTKAQAGRVTVLGRDVREDEENALKRMGGLIEAPAFIPYLSAWDNLTGAALFYDNPMDPAELLALVGLAPYARERVSKFSLGMKQRLGLALALVGRPDFLVLDEPGNGLDIEGTVEIREIILRLRQDRRATFLLSSHIASEIEKTCTRVGVMQDGSLIAVDSMADILTAHASVEDYFLHVVRQRRQGGGVA